MEETYDYPVKRIKQEGELEVTGVSRSGRVRKKSSKLTDFESLDELDGRGGRQKKDKQDMGSPSLNRPIKKEKFIKEEILSDEELVDNPNFTIKQETIYSEESEPEIGYIRNEESSIDSMGSDIDDAQDGDVEPEEAEGFQAIGEESPDELPTQPSALFVDKSTKKKLVIKDGKIVGKSKPLKKEKEKSRCTPFMLWAKEIRQELMRSDPNLDFSQTSKKLGELWATVPFHEKYIWKRRAKRLAAKVVSRPNSMHMSSTDQKKMKLPSNRKFINKQQQMQTVTVANAQVVPVISSPDLKNVLKSSVVDPNSFKQVSTAPLDVAAHLCLLGESLTIIGERLTEHEGQITVSGSLSVLMDSLLCALGPLMCLTQQVPQLNVIPQEQLSQLMDNIAYIMPGL